MGSLALGLAATAGQPAVPAQAASQPAVARPSSSTASPLVRIAPRGELLGVGSHGFSWADRQAERIRWTAYDGRRTVDLGSTRQERGHLYEWDADSSDLVARVEYDDNWGLRQVTLFDPVTGTSQAVDLAGTEYVGTYGGDVLVKRPAAGSGAEFRLVGMHDGVRTERRVTGLSPAKTWVVTGSSPGLLTMEENLGQAYEGGTAVVVDLAKAAVVTRQTVPKIRYNNRAAAVSATHTARLTSPSSATSATLTVLDRATGTSHKLTIRTQPQPVMALLGSTFAVYGTAGEAHSYTGARAAALKAVPLSGGTPRTLLDHAGQVLRTPDGSLVARGGTLAQGQGLFRISLVSGRPVVKKIATTGEPTRVVVLATEAPAVADPDKGPWRIRWNLSRRNVRPYLTITHKETGKSVSRYVAPPRDDAGWIEYPWDGGLDGGGAAPDGAYSWKVTFEPINGIGPTAKAGGDLTVKRAARPSGHDFSANGTADVLERGTDGVLWRYDTYAFRSRGTTAVSGEGLERVGGGWNAYDELVAAGNLGGPAVGDLLARDRTGTLWLYAGKGATGTFAARTKVGGGWNAYTALTGGSDVTGDGRADLLARDRSGVLWMYRGTGSLAKPYAPRVRAGSGWNGYDRITAVGNIAGGPAGDLVARDASGTLWLHAGKGDGTFGARTRIGGGWKAYQALVAAGDYNKDGWSDTLAFGGGRAYVYWGTGNRQAPFSPRALAPNVGFDTDAKLA